MRTTTFRFDLARAAALRLARTRWLTALLAVVAAGSAPAAAQSVERVYPLFPEQGSVVGPRPVFHLGYEAPGEPEVRRLRFRVTLRPVGSGGDRYDFDQRRRRSGWMAGEAGQVIYRPKTPLLDGTYRWRAWVWDGVAWVPGNDTFEVRVDSVPPAEVDRLQVRFDRERHQVVLDWDPVTLDREGGPEYVARYHVYRYERGPVLPIVRSHEIGVVEQPRFVDGEIDSDRSKILFYKVTAEDQAGNEAERRD